MKPAKNFATKGDLARVEKKLVHKIDAIKGELKSEMKATKEEIREEMKATKEEMVHEFRLAVETIRHDLRGANHDAIEQLKDNDKKLDRRVTRLEQSTGLVAA